MVFFDRCALDYCCRAPGLDHIFGVAWTLCGPVQLATNVRVGIASLSPPICLPSVPRGYTTTANQYCRLCVHWRGSSSQPGISSTALFPNMAMAHSDSWQVTLSVQCATCEQSNVTPPSSSTLAIILCWERLYITSLFQPLSQLWRARSGPQPVQHEK